MGGVGGRLGGCMGVGWWVCVWERACEGGGGVGVGLCVNECVGVWWCGCVGVWVCEGARVCGV